MIKRIVLLFFSFFLISVCFAKNALYCNATLAHPCVVKDSNKQKGDVPNWRTAMMMAKAYQGNVKGLDKLWLSASAAPTAKGFLIMAANIKKITHDKVKKMIDVDLRQESHGYLNGDPITFTINYDWINLGLTKQQAIANEKTWLLSLAKQNVIQNVLTPKQFKSQSYNNGITIPIKSIESEEAVAKKAGFSYQRITVSDHMAPLDKEVDQYVSLIKNLSPNDWVHVHCRGGKGRTSTFFVMYDMLKNADQVSFKDIIQRQASIHPFYDLSKTRKQSPLSKFYKERINFLSHFYQYARASLKGYEGTWSQWKKNH